MIGTKTVTASQLFAGSAHRNGDNKCFYCGSSCDGAHETKTYVKDTFTNRDIVKYPASLHVCEGCVMSLGEGRGDMPLIDGTVKKFTSPRGMAPRMYSWLITADEKLAFTKAHIVIVREMLTHRERLPEPPFAWVLSDSGQKQLIFRAPIAWSKNVFSLLLEDMVVDVDVDRLKDVMDLAGSISSKLGKPVLKGDVTFNTFLSAKKHGLEKALEAWMKIRWEPLAQLAAWLAPSKEKE